MSRGKQPKLSASQRKHLLELHDAGTHTQNELAELFSVSAPPSTGATTTRGHSLVMTVPGSMRHNGDALTGCDRLRQGSTRR
jgi:hypothetical protein